jgi:hypothetical protein
MKPMLRKPRRNKMKKHYLRINKMKPMLRKPRRNKMKPMLLYYLRINKKKKRRN